MWPYMRWGFNKQGIVDRLGSIKTSNRAGILVRQSDYICNEDREAERLWFWEHLLKHRRIPPS